MNLDEIQEEITRLESAQTTYSNCDKLATLYIIMEHYKVSPQSVVTVQNEEITSDSEFVEVGSKISKNALLLALEEHMKAIKLMYPKEYAKIINKMKESQ